MISGWGAHRTLGGLFWATYKATCRRSGVFTGAFGPKDFNVELFDPINKPLAGPWERVFQRLIPAALDGLVRKSTAIIETFHLDALGGVQDSGRNPAGINMLSQQLRMQAAALSGMNIPFKAVVTDKQRDANREFTPIIQQAMQQGYTICVDEQGPGSYARMKAAMQSHVNMARHTMFRDATEHVQSLLDSMCDDIQQSLVVFLQSLAAKMERDYMTVLVGDGAQAQDGIPTAERLLRDEMRRPLAEADSWFAALSSPGEDEAQSTVNEESLSDTVGIMSDGALNELIAQQLEESRQPTAMGMDGIKTESM